MRLPSQYKEAIIVGALVLLAVLIGGGGYLIGKNSVPAVRVAGPPDTPLPAHGQLTRTENFALDGVQNWYYSVAQTTEATLLAFYQSQLPKHGWRCFATMTSTDMMVNGQPQTGTGIYITAIRGATKVQIYIGDQAYGAALIQDDLPDGSSALKLSYESTKTSAC